MYAEDAIGTVEDRAGHCPIFISAKYLSDQWNLVRPAHFGNFWLRRNHGAI